MSSALWINWNDPVHDAVHSPSLEEGCEVLAQCIADELALARAARRRVEVVNYEQAQAIVTHLRAAAQRLEEANRRGLP